MPNTRSAKKRMRQANRRNARNRVARSTLRTAIKKVRNATSDTAAAAYRTAEQLLDRAARKGLIHKNAAARGKRRLRRFVTPVS
ncbi:MAG: 30S ribosomal protein S20 [Gemmatimonadota bacterium]|nr:MAG: 30S ribosomal protein S20 [Gemmatimonadota bacterium]